MRRKVTTETLKQFMQEFASAVKGPGRIYFTGGSTALLLGFREQTIDIDIRLDPEPSGAFEAIATLKNRLNVNVELASPADFIPVTKTWRERSEFIASIRGIDFFHFDFALQALSKLERGHAQDMEDVASLIRSGRVTPGELRSRFSDIEPELLRYPALNPDQFRKKVEDFIAGFTA